MRKTAKSSRAPLAPLHNNSLRGESPRKAGRGNDKQSVKSCGHKAANKLHTTSSTRADKAAGSLPDVHGAGSKTAKSKSPTKVRKSVQLVTTSAVPTRSGTLARNKQGLNKPVGAPLAKQAAARTSSTVSHHDGSISENRAVHQSAEPQSAPSSTVAPAAADQIGAGILGFGSLPTDASPPSGVLSHWQVPATPPSISALLGTPEARLTRDVQYFPTQATPESAVKGVGTPQDFSDVFDLDEVSLVTKLSAA